MASEVRTENMTPEAVRAKEEYLINIGAAYQRRIDELKLPELFTDKNGEQ